MYKFIGLLIISTIMSSCNSTDEFRWNPDDITNPQTDVRPYIKDKEFLSILYETAGVKKGEILRLEDLLTIRELVIESGRNIESLDGIQLLRNITYLELYGFLYHTELNLRYNKNLIYLQLSNFLSLTELDLSQNKNLDFVNLFGVEVERLDFSLNPKLRVLILTHSRYIKEIILPPSVEDLILAVCDKLIKPKINHLNKIIQLSIESCPNIKELDELPNFPSLYTLYIGDLDISSIDLSKCTKLIYLSIEECLKLKEIKFGDVKILEGLSFNYNKEQELLIDVSAHKNLTYLFIGGSLLTSLDVSENLNLKSLYCRDSPLLESVYISNLQVFEDLEVESHTSIVTKY